MFGSGQRDFYIDQPEGVAQSVLTRLQLWQGQWFYDVTEGTPWEFQVLGERTQNTRDLAIRARVIDTTGVAGITEYYSIINRQTRSYAVAMTLDTIYGAAVVATSKLPGQVPPLPVQVRAQRLGITGGTVPATDVVDTPADLTQPGQQYIRDFAIRRVDAGHF